MPGFLRSRSSIGHVQALLPGVSNRRAFAKDLQRWRSYAGGQTAGGEMVSDDNLSAVLANVAADARTSTRERIANSPETREFLEIGLLLLRDDLLDHRGPDLQDDH